MDERVDLQFRDHYEFAVGHGVSVEVPPPEAQFEVRTTWLPCCEVRRVVTREAEASSPRWKLSPVEDRGAAGRSVTSYEAYGAWINPAEVE